MLECREHENASDASGCGSRLSVDQCDRGNARAVPVSLAEPTATPAWLAIPRSRLTSGP